MLIIRWSGLYFDKHMNETIAEGGDTWSMVNNMKGAEC